MVRKITILLAFLLLLIGRSFVPGFAQTDTPTPTPDQSQQVSDLQNQIRELEGKISDLQSQEHTLSSQIGVMDSQIKLTMLRIESKKQEIVQLTNDIATTSDKISNLQGSVDSLTKVLLNRIVATYEVGTIPQIHILLASNDITDFFKRANYLKLVQDHDKKLIYDTVQAKNDYANQKQIFEDKKKQVLALQAQLQDYTAQLQQQKTAKQTLLTQTQGSEANYEKLLAQAQAQLAGFSSFAQSQGGASILTGQTFCDNWGCYYNQRDSQWGSLALNHTQYSIASDGCLLTSVAMVITHYGHQVTPIDINANPSNFASYYPAYLLYTVSAGGVSASRIGATIDAMLNDGNNDPVIVGIRYSSGDTHFVVLKSGSGGSYIMDDPFTPSGHDISFSSHYSLSSIFEVDKVVIQ